MGNKILIFKILFAGCPAKRNRERENWSTERETVCVAGTGENMSTERLRLIGLVTFAMTTFGKKSDLPSEDELMALLEL